MRTKLSTYMAPLALLGASTLFFAGCDEVLSVSNPEQIPITDLNDANLLEVQVAGVIGDFTHMYDDPFLWRGSMFTDMQITGINWEQTARLSQRIVKFDENDADGMYSEISQALRQAEDVTQRIKNLADANDERIGTTLVFAGYSYIIMAEAMCEAVISTTDVLTGEFEFGTEILSSEQVFTQGLSRFQEALTNAMANGNDDVANLARAGLARSYLALGNYAETMNWAALVPQGFEWWLEFSANTSRENLVLRSRTSGSNHSLGMHPNFLNGTFGDQDLISGQTDPRVQHTPSWSLGHNRLTKLYKPYPGLRFDNYYGGTIAADGDDDNFELFQRETNVLLADYVSAQHDWMEAMAAGNAQDASVLAFIDARRTVGNMGPFAGGTDAEVRAELREQRARDLFLGGFRLGDLRRWIRLGVGDFFPSGQHPNAQWGNYGDATCFPLPLEEYEGNPNLKKP